jgi:DNA-binding GntR family transcriptional regulator
VPADQRNSDVTQRLREAIVSQRFMPNERLVEVDLVDYLGTNRANVRTALARLEQEGLVVSEPNRGARVRLVTEAEALEITEARNALEALAARQAAARAGDKDRARLGSIVREMHAAVASGDLLGYSAINGRFHAEIQRIAANATLARLLGTLNSQVVRFQYRAILMPGRAHRSLTEHEAIAEAIASGDGKAAERAMRVHLEHVLVALRRAMKEPLRDCL